jgi:hypothetical protein
VYTKGRLEKEIRQKRDQTKKVDAFAQGRNVPFGRSFLSFIANIVASFVGILPFAAKPICSEA